MQDISPPIWQDRKLPLKMGSHSGSSADYAEFTIQLSVGAQLTLYTDGVVEARARSGELLGFDRAAAMSTQPAEVIAQTAQSFGQDDDITVLTATLEAPALALEAPLRLPGSLHGDAARSAR